MTRVLPLLALAVLLPCLSAVPRAGAASGPPPAFATEPCVTPDGREIAFVSGGDIWTVPASGGEARLLVSHPSTESRPLYSPDGTKLAFVSTRTGNGDIYVLTLATGALKRITFADSADNLSAWSWDGRWLYFNNSSSDIEGMQDVYRVSIEGGTPLPVTADRYTTEFFGAPSPDGKTLAFTARGDANTQWWRKGHSHLDESELWLLTDGKYEQVTPDRRTQGGARELWPMWSPDGRTLYYVSDRGGTENVWKLPLGGKAAAVTHFTSGRVLWPSLAYDGKTLVFERDFGVWKLDLGTGAASAVPITLRGSAATPAQDHVSLSTFRELAISPDGKKLALIGRGQVWAAGAKEGGEAVRITTAPDALSSDITWAPDSRRLVYVSRREGAANLYSYDFGTRAETRLTDSALDDASPVFSPDGKLLLFQRDARELHLYDVGAKSDRVLAKAYLSRPPFIAQSPFTWSPDGKWVAYLAAAARGFENAWVVPVAGGDPRQVSFVSNTGSGSITWSPDGKYLLFSTGQRTEPSQLAKVDLVPQPPKFREDKFRELFQEAPKPEPKKEPKPEPKPAEPAPAKKELEIRFEGLRDRISFFPAGLDVDDHAVSPDGKWVVFVGTVSGQPNLYLYSVDENAPGPAVARQLTSTAGRKTNVQFSADSREVWFLESGRPQAIGVDTHAARAVGVTAELDVDFATEKAEVFRQTWTYLRDFFYDEKFHGADWNAVRTQYEPHALGAATPDELRRVISEMIGELNASHLGISTPGNVAWAVGRLGLDFDRAEFEANGRLKVTRVIPQGPADLSGGIHSGDYILAVEDQTIGAHTNLDELLMHRIGRRVELSISPSATGEGKRAVPVRPVSTLAERELRYRDWVIGRRAYVESASGGRLGYVHMVDMSQESLNKLYTQLDAENQGREGVVIDIRNNEGGFVNVYAIDVLARRGYLQMRPRGRTSAPGRALLGQRALELPTVLVTNQHSLSDAEDFTEGYRALKLGKVVGEPTAGWIIFTSGVPLLDGSQLRLPFVGIFDSQGQPLELHPRPVDVYVHYPVGESYSGKDSQLDTAVKELLAQIGPRTPVAAP